MYQAFLGSLWLSCWIDIPSLSKCWGASSRRMSITCRRTVVPNAAQESGRICSPGSASWVSTCSTLSLPKINFGWSKPGDPANSENLEPKVVLVFSCVQTNQPCMKEQRHGCTIFKKTIVTVPVALLRPVNTFHNQFNALAGHYTKCGAWTFRVYNKT